MGNGHAIHVQYSACKYIGLVIYLLLFYQKFLYYLFLLRMLLLENCNFPWRDNKQTNSFIQFIHIAYSS